MTIEYAVVIERGAEGCSAYVPDLPGCVAAADTEEEVTALIREAIEFHLEGMRENGEPIPQPGSRAVTIDVAPLAVQTSVNAPTLAPDTPVTDSATATVNR